MELLNNKTDYLLEAGLPDLHQQSIQWLNELAFAMDETAFLAVYTSKLTADQVPLKAKDVFIQINQELLALSGGELDDLKKEIEAHERVLNNILESRPDNDDDFRKKHQNLAFKFMRLENRFRELKTEIFSLTKSYHEELLIPSNETVKTIYSRRAVRKYKDKTVLPQLVEQILDAGRMAPSAMNHQPWKFYVLTGKENIKAVSSEIAQVVKSFFHGFNPGTSLPEDPIFHGAPLVIFLTVPKQNDWAMIDIGACAQNIMLAAQSLGLDSCPVGLAKFVEQTPAYSKLAITQEEQIALAIVIGYGNEQPEIHERKKDNVTYIH